MKQETHYEIVTFYARTHRVKANSEAQARDKIAARALTSNSESYTQLWKCYGDADGEQIALFENNQEVRLTLPPKANNRATLSKR